MFSDYESNWKKILIVICIIPLLLFIIAIVCLTYQYFTNSEDDGKIGVNVTSGKFKVDIIDTADKSLIGDVLDFVSKDEKKQIYFEPGATYYTEGFRVKNTGSIPLKFHVFINEDGLNDSEKFHEAFELWITKDRESLENAEKLTEFMGELDVEQTSETYYLVIRMKKNAGNEFQNKTYTGIGITVYAVQSNVDIGE